MYAERKVSYYYLAHTTTHLPQENQAKVNVPMIPIGYKWMQRVVSFGRSFSGHPIVSLSNERKRLSRESGCNYASG